MIFGCTKSSNCSAKICKRNRDRCLWSAEWILIPVICIHFQINQLCKTRQHLKIWQQTLVRRHKPTSPYQIYSKQLQVLMSQRIKPSMRLLLLKTDFLDSSILERSKIIIISAKIQGDLKFLAHQVTFSIILVLWIRPSVTWAVSLLICNMRESEICWASLRRPISVFFQLASGYEEPGTLTITSKAGR